MNTASGLIVAMPSMAHMAPHTKRLSGLASRFLNRAMNGAITAAGAPALVENHGGWQVPVAGDVALTITLTQRTE